MKKKQIEKVPLKRPNKMENMGRHVTAQLSGDYLILDLWRRGLWSYRHAVDINTGEYASYDMAIIWTNENLYNAFAKDIWTHMNEDAFPISDEDKKIILEALTINWECHNVYERIGSLEREYSREIRSEKEYRRLHRVHELMDSVPNVGKAVYDWIEEKMVGSLHYAILDKGSGVYYCTDCGMGFTEEAAGVRMKHRGHVTCPMCHRELVVEKKGSSISTESRLTLIHSLDEKRGIQRHFKVKVHWECGLTRTVTLHEIIRCMMHKGDWSRNLCDIYYMQHGEWDNKDNKCNCRWKTGYLYPYGIKEGMNGTHYQGWSEVFSYMATAGLRANYNRLMADTGQYFIGMIEYLAKGRFYRLLEETSEKVNYNHGYHFGNAMDCTGSDIYETMRLRDKQKINRLRQENGGINMLEWLQWSDGEKKKIGSDVLEWYEKNGITNREYSGSIASYYLSPEQLMHYLDRQIKESYGGKKRAKIVLETYNDYLSMAIKLKKHMSDVMVYRPRELKRRHDEAVEEHRRYLEAEKTRNDRKRARAEAKRMREKYPGSEAILAEIKPKYEYKGEHFQIVVPKSFYDITSEGMALHHCAGSSERYFDRILQHETYICFLRRVNDPKKPFYTIEVEPGGTIRQHRGMYDAEPGIEEIKPFLREWQKEIRRRMSKEDHERAEISAVKREQNMDELREKNNTKVLDALMEDLMEAV